MKRNRLLSLLLALGMTAGLTACSGGQEQPQPTPTASQTTEVDKVGVFYYSFSDAYLSIVREALDADLSAAGVSFTNYDGKNDQSVQQKDIDAALEEGCNVLAVNLVHAGSAEDARAILDKAAAKGAKVIFFNRPVEEENVQKTLLGEDSYQDMTAYVGTDSPQAGHLQGEMIANYVLEHYDEVDLNGDGTISYAMFMGDEAHADAIYRTRYSVEDADAMLTQAGKPPLRYFDEANSDGYQADENGTWSAEAANRAMAENLTQYNDENGNMIELVICNNDEMARGAIEALQAVGYNTGNIGAKTIPVFGVDATDTAQQLIAQGMMTGTIKQDAEGMANAICQLTQAATQDVALSMAVSSLVAGDPTYSLAEGTDNKVYVAYATFTVR